MGSVRLRALLVVSALGVAAASATAACTGPDHPATLTDGADGGGSDATAAAREYRTPTIGSSTGSPSRQPRAPIMKNSS